MTQIVNDLVPCNNCNIIREEILLLCWWSIYPPVVLGVQGELRWNGYWRGEFRQVEHEHDISCPPPPVEHTVIHPGDIQHYQAKLFLECFG